MATKGRRFPTRSKAKGAGFVALAFGLFASLAAASAAPIPPRILVSPVIERAEAGERVRSWYWQQPRYFDEPQYAFPNLFEDYDLDESARKSVPRKRIKKQSLKNKELTSRNTPKSRIKQPDRLTCEAATEIVAGYAFSNVKPLSCSGSTYQFQAMRQDRPFSVVLSARDGELIKVRKLEPTASASVQ